MLRETGHRLTFRVWLTRVDGEIVGCLTELATDVGQNLLRHARLRNAHSVPVLKETSPRRVQPVVIVNRSQILSRQISLFTYSVVFRYFFLKTWNQPSVILILSLITLIFSIINSIKLYNFNYKFIFYNYLSRMSVDKLLIKSYDSFFLLS